MPLFNTQSLPSPAEARGASKSGINDTMFHRLAVLAIIKFLRPFRLRRGNILFLSKNLCIKYGVFIQLSEAFTLQYIASNTTIPVPKVYCAFVHNRCTYILMQRIHGHPLQTGWLLRTPASQECILAQLRHFIDQLRSLPPPGPNISNILGGSLYDPRFPGSSQVVGPFPGIHEFHAFLTGGMQPPLNGAYPDIRDMIHLQHQPWPLPVFTHADLSMFNILVHGDCVVAIIDWETAGWYPYYWEFSMAFFQFHPYTEFWAGYAHRFIDPLSASELEMERTRHTYFGPF